MVWILGLYLLNSILMLIVAISEVRKPAKALLWLTISLCLPVIGFGLYLFTSNPVHIRRERLTSPDNKSDTLPDSFGHSATVIVHALRHMCVHGLQSGQVQVLVNGIKTYNKLIESLQNAQRTIDLEYYIYRDDQIGRCITDLLIERATAGVQVRFMRDGWGSRQFPKHQILRMLEAGIECRTIFPLRFPWLLSNWTYRDHCKNVVIDGKEGFTGGINIGYEYTGLKPDVGFWRDTHVRMVGEVEADLQAIFDNHWNLASPEQMKKRSFRNRKAEDTPSQNITLPGRVAHSGWSPEWNYEVGTINDISIDTAPNADALQRAYIQTVEGNPGIPTDVIRETYFICITQATQTIDITTPYFVPDSDIIMAIKTAVTRGVRVRLLVPNQIELSTLIVGAASRTFYGELLEAGVNIHLYNKGMLHAKLMIIDGEISTVGTANYDMRSFRLNYEACEIIYSSEVAKELTEQFEYDITHSVPFNVEDLLKFSLPQRIIDQGARLLSPLL
ncbi:MAG: phospholipase D-like domain-containing protein [Desulfosporosinus sp.]|nr:phospholipase D-like domain-containing protein [Desulfosporosinus sp.]